MPRRCRPSLGTFVEIECDSEPAIEAAFAAIERVHRLMSAHEPDSDLSRINRFAHLAPVAVDEWTAWVLERALFWSRESEGAFDVVRAGHSAIESGYLPRHGGQPEPVAAHWSWLEIQGRSVRLLKAGCVDLGGIAKGFAVDRAIETLRAAGARSGLVNAGGDLACFGPEPSPVRIAHPRTRSAVAKVWLSNEALATSAIHADHASPHLPGRDRRYVSATVRARQAVDADALTKVMFSGSPVAGRCLDLAGADGLLLSPDGGVEAVERIAA